MVDITGLHRCRIAVGKLSRTGCVERGGRRNRGEWPASEGAEQAAELPVAQDRRGDSRSSEVFAFTHRQFVNGSCLEVMTNIDGLRAVVLGSVIGGNGRPTVRGLPRPNG